MFLFRKKLHINRLLKNCVFGLLLVVALLGELIYYQCLLYIEETLFVCEPHLLQVWRQWSPSSYIRNAVDYNFIPTKEMQYTQSTFSVIDCTRRSPIIAVLSEDVGVIICVPFTLAADCLFMKSGYINSYSSVFVMKDTCCKVSHKSMCVCVCVYTSQKIPYLWHLMTPYDTLWLLASFFKNFSVW